MDEVNENFHLLSTSPVIDAGNSVNTPPYDIDGDPRPLGNGYDIGADEYSGSPPEPNPCEGDFDNDGDVDGSDLAIFATDFGRTDCPVSP